MRINELFRPQTIEDAGDILQRAGYQEIGAGTWASVYHKPGAQNVLKLFKSGDIGFQHYLNLITRIRNPHFPVIKGRPVQITPQYYGVQMELLQPMSPQIEAQFGQIDWDHPQNVPGTLGQALQLIWQYVYSNSGVIPDINISSVMQRGNTLVIVDPAEPW